MQSSYKSPVQKQYLAFGHEKRVGKDTCARLAITHLRTTNKFPKIEFAGFADEVKRQCYRLYSWAGMQDGHFYEDPSNEYLREVILPLLNLSPRQVWIGYANRVREFRESTWVDFLLEGSTADFLVIKDARFPKETMRIQQMGGHAIKVVRPGITRTSDEADDALLGWDGWDATIVNDGTLADLNRRVIDVLTNICKV